MLIRRWHVSLAPFDPSTSSGATMTRATLIRREPLPDGRVSLILELPVDHMVGAVSVVGNFNMQG